MSFQNSENNTELPMSMRVTAAALPLLIAGLLLWLVVGAEDRSTRFDVPLDIVWATDADTLESIFSRHDYFWPPKSKVPPLLVRQIPLDISRLSAKRKKSLFFRALLPIVMAENERLRRLQQAVGEELETGTPSPGSEKGLWLAALAGDYGIKVPVSDPLFERQLSKRLDVVPPGLALAQAANESAWGTSRFATEGNNLFGEWTWNPDQGMVPLRRTVGADHLVRRFPDLRSSVRAYLKNLNTGSAYRDLRRIRAEMRAAGRPLAPEMLAGGLRLYSERGAEYVAEIRAMIRHNGLSDLGPLQLAGSPKAD